MFTVQRDIRNTINNYSNDLATADDLYSAMSEASMMAQAAYEAGDSCPADLLELAKDNSRNAYRRHQVFQRVMRATHGAQAWDDAWDDYHDGDL